MRFVASNFVCFVHTSAGFGSRSYLFGFGLSSVRPSYKPVAIGKTWVNMGRKVQIVDGRLLIKIRNDRYKPRAVNI